MNALTMGSYAVIAIIGFLVLWKLYKLVKAEGASQQKDKTNRKGIKVAKEYLKRAYDGVVGTDGFGVLNPKRWRPRPPKP